MTSGDFVAPGRPGMLHVPTRVMLRIANRVFGRRRRAVVIAADFCARGDIGYRLAGEIRGLAAAGSMVSLLQTRRPDEGESVSAEVRTCIRRGLAQRIRSGDRADCGMLILHQPARADDPAGLMARVEFGRCVVVCHTPEDAASIRGLENRASRVSVFATSPMVQTGFEPAKLASRFWVPMVDARVAAGMDRPRRHKLAVCWLSIGEQALPHLRETERLSNGVEHHALGAAFSRDHPRLDSLSLDRVIAGMDVFVLPPEGGASEPPDTVVAAALQSGRPVVLPRGLQPHYGRGPVYYEASGFQEALRGAIATAEQGGTGRARRGAAEFAARSRRAPVRKLRRHRIGRTRNVPTDDRPVLFLPSNGVGVGHLTRLLAIARRMERKAVFASQAAALQAIRDFRFAAEYIPSHAVTGGDFDAWDAWFSSELERVAEAYDPALVVYDGNHLSPGLLHAVASRRDCRLAWVRRGMWARTTSRFLANARFCDLVIEPGELAGERDDGATSLLRHEVRAVDPIRLLDPEELPDRRAAALALDLDPNRPACLVQLGSGSNRDLLSLLDRIIQDLRRHPTLQIAVAEWVGGSVPLTLWPEVTVLRGFPISQHLRAFDFCISAAGYNSFHEMIGFCVPTIFLANQTPTMDDQSGRAKFAQDNAAAFEISDSDMGELPDLIALMMEAKARSFLAERCARLARPNGAAEAARALEALCAAAEAPLT